MMSPFFLPIVSAIGATSNAPKKVPADKMETTRDSVEEGRYIGPSGGATPKVFNQS